MNLKPSSLNFIFSMVNEGISIMIMVIIQPTFNRNSSKMEEISAFSNNGRQAWQVYCSFTIAHCCTLYGEGVFPVVRRLVELGTVFLVITT